jgi:hypothetical protein
MKKLYKVAIEAFAVVVAEDEKEACRIARHYGSEIMKSEGDSAQCICEIKSISDLPYLWNSDCLPYGTNEDKTIFDYLFEVK